MGRSRGRNVDRSRNRGKTGAGVEGRSRWWSLTLKVTVAVCVQSDFITLFTSTRTFSFMEIKRGVGRG